MGLKEWLLPPEREFFDLLDRQAGFVLEGAHALRDLLKDFRDVPERRRAIKDIEHKGDETVHTIYEALNKTFITPIDREDITALATDLDNVLDLVEAAAALQKAVGMIRDMKNAEDIEKICVEVNRLENVADDLLNISVATLFHDLDVVRILQHKEILERRSE